MKYTFKLKEPKSEKETVILFCCEFKAENKKFVFSTREKINSINWDFDNKFIFTEGQKKTKFSESIKMPLNRHSNLSLETESLYIRIKEDFRSKTLRSVFDEEFKITSKGKNIFFDAYDVFMAEKKATLQWSAGTVKRYTNIKNTLKTLEIAKNHPLIFSKIDLTFY